MRRLGVLDLEAERQAALAAMKRVRIERSPDALVGELSPAEKTLVAIGRAFSRGASLLILDEATSTLTQREANRVMEVLATLVADGGSVIMVTHRLAEVIDATNRVVALVDGTIAHDGPTASLDREALARLLLHQPHIEDADDQATTYGDVVLRMSDAHAPGVGPVDLEVRAGEVFGLTGNQGAGLNTIAFLASRTMKPTRGSVWHAPGAGVAALVPPHRETEGGFQDHTILENMSISALPRLRRQPGLIGLTAESAAVEEMLDRLRVKPHDSNAIFGSLSGGNKQKVIMARSLLSGGSFFVLCEPTRGVDPATRADIYRLIRQLRASGAGILVVTSDAEDLLAVSDRVAVVVAGRIEHAVALSELDHEGLEAFV